MANRMGVALRGWMDNLVAVGDVLDLGARRWRPQSGAEGATSIWGFLDAGMGSLQVEGAMQVDPRFAQWMEVAACV